MDFPVLHFTNKKSAKHINTFSGIYKIINTHNNKCYIGSTRNLLYRFKAHQRDLSKGNHVNTILQRSWQKYNGIGFEFHVIEMVERLDLLLEREQHYIDTINPEYNICRIAGNTAGRKFSDETKKKLSAARKGRFAGEDSPRFGIPNLKLIELNKLRAGTSASPEARRKMSQNSPKKKTVLQYDKNNSFIREYDTITQAQTETGANASCIVNTCKGRRKSAGGFIWKYKE